MFTSELKKQKGFTLIELLVSMVILMLVMLGFLAGILQYTTYALRNQYRNEASKIATQIVNELNSRPLSNPIFANIYPNRSAVDSNNNGIAMFCDPNETVNVTNCQTFDNLNLPTLGPNRAYSAYKGVNFNHGLIILPYGIPTTPQPVYVCVLVWYQDQTNNRCEYIATLVIKGY